MAEGLLRDMASDHFHAFSAGTVATVLQPEAIRVMDEIGIDIRGQYSKSLERYRDDVFDWVITLCDSARESCPVFPGARTAHWNAVDPASFDGEQERLHIYRNVRDALAVRIRLFAIANGRSSGRRMSLSAGQVW